MRSLTETDLNFIVPRIPRDVRRMMRKLPLYAGGGFIREIIAGNKANDIDLFGPSAEQLRSWAFELAGRRSQDGKGSVKVHETDNAFSVFTPPQIPVQFISRWLFEGPEAVISSFDFTVCQAVIWFTGEKWESLCSNGFYEDLAAKRLVYTFPTREEAAAGSMMRVRKFLGRGYNIQANSLAGVMARVFRALDQTKLGHDPSEQHVATVVAGLLREVDPSLILDGVEVAEEGDIRWMTEDDE